MTLSLTTGPQVGWTINTSLPRTLSLIAAYLGTTLGDAVINRFNNGEVQAMINESVACKNPEFVFICQHLDFLPCFSWIPEMTCRKLLF